MADAQQEIDQRLLADIDEVLAEEPVEEKPVEAEEDNEKDSAGEEGDPSEIIPCRLRLMSEEQPTKRGRY